MFKFFRRHGDAQSVEQPHRPPPPTTPVEVGLSLRSAREREGLSLEDLRARTDVPMVDLEALERGRLDLFHVEQAAIVVLWRYAEIVGLEPESMVEVVRKSWPTPALSVDFFHMPNTLSSTPVANLTAASSLLGPIVSPNQLTASASQVGLSKSMLAVLSSASIGASRAVAMIGPGPVKKANGTKSKSKSDEQKKSPGKPKKIEAKKTETKALSKSSASDRDTPSSEPRQFPPVLERVSDQTPLRSFPAPALQSPPTEQATHPSAPDLGDRGESRGGGQWGARLAKVIAERFGIEGTQNTEDSSSV